MTEGNRKKWREFEVLVARLEHLLGPRGAVVKSPDRLPDKVTGQLREVDASVRYQVGSVLILITIECRDRSAVQDDTWIEQLVQKKEKLGASATVAVSSTGFTAPARRTAENYGIELRTLKETSDHDVSMLTEHITLELEFREWKYLDFKAFVEVDKSEIQLTDEFLRVMQSIGYEAPAAFRESDRRPITLGEIGEKLVAEGLYPPISGIKPFGIVQFGDDTYVMPTTYGEIRVNRFEIKVEVNFVRKPCSLKKVFEYGELNKPLVRLAEYEALDVGAKIHVASALQGREGM
jgi:hypothetical protein